MPSSLLTRRFTARNILALATIAALTLGGHLLAERERAGLAEDLRLANLAGRQRALGQQIVKAALGLGHAADVREAQRWRDELRGATSELLAGHTLLESGGPLTDDPGLVALAADVKALQQAAAGLLARSDPRTTRPALDAVIRQEGPFLARVEDLIARLGAEADAHLAALRWLGYLVAFSVLVALLLEGLLVFRPAVARLSHEMHAQTRLQRQLLDAVTAEQHRLGSDLHDGLLQQLTGLSLLIRSLLTRASRGAALEAKDLAQIGTLLDDAIAEARRMSRAMMPVVLEQKGLAYALEDMSKQANASGRARCTARIELRGRLPEPSKSNHIYRIAQEAVQNALKHSQAANISVELVDTGDAIELRISDDGIGLITPTGASRTGMGLRTMEYRARAIGAELRLEPGRPTGTIVRCRLPDAQLWEASADHREADAPRARAGR